jgi:hypothetical protein
MGNTDSGRARRKLETLLARPSFAWAVAVALGVVNVIPVRFVMNPDGISYLNLATLYRHGDWATAINGYWSPLYPLLIAATFRLVPTSSYLESTVVHALTFVIYLGAFAAFRFLLAEIRARQEPQEGSGDEETAGLSFRSLSEVACAHALFFWAALSLVGFALVTPDMTVALLVFVASGLALRLKRHGSTTGYLGLGAVIGLAYLTKAVMFPLGVVMCLSCGIPASIGMAVRRSAIATAGFLIIAIPQLIAMSNLSGHFSYGESGTIAYANEVNRVPKMWVGEPPGSGTPAHPMTLISRTPSAYEFSLPNTTLSYPVSDELAHWMQGVRPHVSIREQLEVTNRILSWYLGVFDVLVVAAVTLLFLRRRIRPDYLAVIVPAGAALVLYALVYAEARYLAAWVVVLFLGFAASIQFGRNAIRGAVALTAALAVYYGMSSLNASRLSVIGSIPELPHAQFETAVELEKLGVKPGSRVGALGYAFNAYWARLAGVQIAMQVPDVNAYSSAPDLTKANILKSFRDAGAVAVVSTGNPGSGPGAHWQQLGPAGYWILMLQEGR